MLSEEKKTLQFALYNIYIYTEVKEKVPKESLKFSSLKFSWKPQPNRIFVAEVQLMIFQQNRCDVCKILSQVQQLL